MKVFRDRVAVVTGAGGGLGRAMSVALAREGARVAVVDVHAGRAEQSAEAVRAVGGQATTHTVDIADRAAVEALVAEVVSAHGAVHLLFNNAGVAAFCPFGEQSIEDFEWVVGINFMGAVYATKFFLPHLLAQDEGHIVNISSMAAFIGMPNQAVYSSTKAALHAFSESLDGELAETAVNVTSVLPGAVATGIARGARGVDARKDKISAIIDKAPAPDAVALEILAAVRAERFELLPTKDAKAMYWAGRLAPGGVRRAFAWAERWQNRDSR